MEEHLKQEVAQFFFEHRRVVRLDGLHHLVGFLDEVGLEALMILLLVPGAAVRRSETGHDLHSALETAFIFAQDLGLTNVEFRRPQYTRNRRKQAIMLRSGISHDGRAPQPR